MYKINFMLPSLARFVFIFLAILLSFSVLAEEGRLKLLGDQLYSCDLIKSSIAADAIIKNFDDPLFLTYLPFLSANLYRVGRKDESVFWLNVYFLRRRYIQILLNQKLEDSKIEEGVSFFQPILNYARRNIDNYISEARKAIEWDRTNINPISKRAGFEALSPKMELMREQFLKERLDLLNYKNEWEKFEDSRAGQMQSQLETLGKCKD